MRLLIAAGAVLLLATPAAAQRLDTRRIDVRETPTSTMCVFNAYRELTLIDGTKGGHGKVGSWNGAPAEDADARLRLVFEPAKGNWRTPPFLGIGFTVPITAKLTQKTVFGARMSLDGEPAIALQYNASTDKLVFAVNRDLDTIGPRLIAARSVVLEILDSVDDPIRRLTWDTSRLDEAFETISVVGWSCSSP